MSTPDTFSAPPSPRRSGWLGSRWTFLALGAVLGLGVGLGAGLLVWNNEPVSSDEVEPVVVTEAQEAPEEEPSPAPPVVNLAPSDFEIGVRVLSKQCFGSAGCNITFRIDPVYVGSDPLPEAGVIEVIYEIQGMDDPHLNTFTITGGQAEFEGEEFGGTPSANSQVTASVSEVIYNPEF
jgi:hypothetical protein